VELYGDVARAPAWETAGMSARFLSSEAGLGLVVFGFSAARQGAHREVGSEGFEPNRRAVAEVGEPVGRIRVIPSLHYGAKEAWKRTVVGSPPAPSGYTCTPGATTVKISGDASTSVSALERVPGTVTPLNSSNAYGKDHLLFTLTLPTAAPGDLGEVTACSGPPGGTNATEDLQGCSTTLTYTLQPTLQRG
jgi:hypothetical protein